MSDRTVKAILKADVSSLVSGMKAAQKATDDFAKNSMKSATTHKASWQQLGQTSMIAGAALALGVGLAVKAFMDFDKEMSVVRAVSGATAGQMDKLRAAAMKAGADTKFSASEAATAEAELAKVGISTADILGGALTGSLNLAAAGNLDLGAAAEISGQAMKIFNLHGKDVGHIADVLASGANKSAADVTSLADAMKQGGLVAAQTGLTLEDTVGTLSAFADNALNGSDAGTSLKTMLQRLNPQSEQAAKLMDELGLRAYDAGGKFVGISQYAGLLQTKLAGMTDEQRNATMQILFGSDAVRGANILYKEGAAGIDGYVKAVNDNGAAARVAAIQMDNLSGDLEQLKGSVETALIQAGSGGNAVLRDMAQFATGAVNAFGEMPAPMQKSALGLTALAAGGLLTIGAIGTLYPKLQETKKALEAVAGSSKFASGAIKGLGKAAGIAAVLAAAAAALAAFTNATATAVPGIEATTSALLKSGDAAKNVDVLFKNLDPRGDFGDATPAVNDLASAFKRVTDKSGIDSFSDSLDGMFGAINGATKSSEVFRNIGNALGTLVTSGHADQAKVQFDAMAAKLGLTGDETNQLMHLMPAYGEAIAGAANETKLAAGGTDTLATAQTDLATEATKAKDAIDAEVQGLQSAGLVVLSTRAATRDFAQAQRDATASLKENGKSLADGTVKGDANATVLDKVASSALGLADSIYKQTGSEEAMRGSLIKSRASLVQTYLQFDNNRGRANAYADSILKIPASKTTTVGVKGIGTSMAALSSWQKYIDGLHGKTVTITQEWKNVQRNIAFGKAAGGLLDGPGTGTSDSIPLWGSKGEYMVKAAAVSKYGVSHFDDLNSMRFAAGGYTGPRSSGSTAGPSSPAFNVEKMTVIGYNPDDAVRKFGHEVSWQMAGR